MATPLGEEPTYLPQEQAEGPLIEDVTHLYPDDEATLDVPDIPGHDRPWPATAQVYPPDARTVAEVKGEYFGGQYRRRPCSTTRPVGVDPDAWAAFNPAARAEYIRDYERKYGSTTA